MGFQMKWIFASKYHFFEGGWERWDGRKQISGLNADVVTLAEDREMLNIPNPQFIAFE